MFGVGLCHGALNDVVDVRAKDEYFVLTQSRSHDCCEVRDGDKIVSVEIVYLERDYDERGGRREEAGECL